MDLPENTKAEIPELIALGVRTILGEPDIVRPLDNLLHRDISYLLTSAHSDCFRNTDVPAGALCLLNPRLPPWSFGAALAIIDDWIAGFHRRHLALWTRAGVAEALGSTPDWRRLLRPRSPIGS